MEIYSVTTILEYLKTILEIDDHTADLWLRGEVSNFSRSPNGHMYFRLKDEGGLLECALFKNSAIRQKVLPKDGSSFIMHGRISIYEATGRLQFYVNEVFADGLGRLSLEFERLKKRLEEEGLFAPERKRPLPERPKVIGVVTSERAAAYQDILNVLRRRYPLAQVILSPTVVQGDSAPVQIVAAIQALNTRPEVEVIILARGGGSIEELWAFNDERVARAVFASRQPIVTGVGHETDFTIVDYVSDLRAPTPSAAAELVSPDINDLKTQVANQKDELSYVFEDIVGEKAADLAALQRRFYQYSPANRVPQFRQKIDGLVSHSQRELQHRFKLQQLQVRAMQYRLKVLNPNQILQRGYAIVSDVATGTVISDISLINKDDNILVRVSNGQFGAKVENVE